MIHNCIIDIYNIIIEFNSPKFSLLKCTSIVMIVFDNHVYCSQVSKKYRGSASVLEEKQEELKVQKDEIKLLRMTVESYDSKVNEQTDLINKLQKELTNVKGNRN